MGSRPPPSDHEVRMTQFFLEVALSVPTPVAEPVDDPEGGGEVGPGDNPADDDSICGAEVPVTWCEIEFPDTVTRRYAKVPINIGDPKGTAGADFRLRTAGRSPMRSGTTRAA
jgi:hypothetical protein